MSGRCDARPELAARPIALDIRIPALPRRGGAALAERFFCPLGWTVDARPVPLDPELPSWGDSRYVDLRLQEELRLADALNHLHVLLPVLDDAKHYSVGSDEVDKLIRAGEGWLGAHPEKELISGRYLAHRKLLMNAALERLAEVDGADLLDGAVAEVGDDSPAAVEADRPVSTCDTASYGGDRRTAGNRRAAGGGPRLRRGRTGRGAAGGFVVRRGRRDRCLGPNGPSAIPTRLRALTSAERRLHVAEMSDRQRERLRLFQSSVTYADERLAGLDAAVLTEVAEHVDPPRCRPSRRPSSELRGRETY
jgi:hypothetical protein